METNLIVQNNQETKTLDSREVAEMLGKGHAELLRDIDGRDNYVGIIPTLEKANLALSDYFILSSYKSGNRDYKCYLVTKMGCEMLGNKQQGEKGILFTAKYVKRFNEMENIIQENEFTKKLPTTFKDALLLLVEAEDEKERLNNKILLLNEQNNALSKDLVKWADEKIINALVRKHGANNGNDFGGSWIEFKRNLLYTYSINLNSRISNYMDTTGKKTKPKTLSLLRDKEELTKALKTAISMCNNSKIDISDILGKHLNNNDIKMIEG